MLFVWSINGQLLSVVNAVDSTFDPKSNVVLAIAFSVVRILYFFIISRFFALF